MADIAGGIPPGGGFTEPEVYKQELKRTLGPFQVFAISFAFISVAVAQALVALVYAQFAARISLSGSAYQWASRAAMIMGLATLVGFDSAANLAEEAKDPYRSVPRAIVGSVAAAGVLGLLFLITLTVAIDSVPQVTDSDSPIAAIIRHQLGPAPERIFLVVITLAFFGAGTAVMTACSRLVFAMSRDSRFPAYRLMRRVNPHTHTPIPATLLTFVVGVVLMIALPGAALLKLIVASTILPAIIYGSTIVLYLVVRKRLGRKEGAFNLGRLELPVAISALV